MCKHAAILKNLQVDLEIYNYHEASFKKCDFSKLHVK